MNKSHLRRGFVNAFLVLIYVFLVASMMNSNIGDRIESKLLGGIGFLMLFVSSAAIVGALMFGKSIIHFLDGNKQDAIMLGIYSIAWLAILTAISLLVALAF